MIAKTYSPQLKDTRYYVSSQGGFVYETGKNKNYHMEYSSFRRLYLCGRQVSQEEVSAAGFHALFLKLNEETPLFHLFYNQHV
jgi:hypothetical protein